MKVLAVSAVVILVTIASRVPPATADTGSVAGSVLDERGGIVDGAQVILRCPVAPWAQSLVVDAAGAFDFPTAPAASCTVQALAPGYQDLRQAALLLRLVAQGEHDVRNGKVEAQAKVFADLRARLAKR